MLHPLHPKGSQAGLHLMGHREVYAVLHPQCFKEDLAVLKVEEPWLRCAIWEEAAPELELLCLR